MIDTGWEQWADRGGMPDSAVRDMADACVDYLQRKPDARFHYRILHGVVVAAARGEDGTIMAWTADLRAERMIYADDSF